MRALSIEELKFVSGGTDYEGSQLMGPTQTGPSFGGMAGLDDFGFGDLMGRGPGKGCDRACEEEKVRKKLEEEKRRREAKEANERLKAEIEQERMKACLLAGGNYQSGSTKISGGVGASRNVKSGVQVQLNIVYEDTGYSCVAR